MSGTITAADVATWADELDRVAERLLPHFVRREPRERAVAYIRALLGDAQRKNGWQLAEQLGDSTPDGVQHLLARAEWKADAVRDDLTQYVAQHLGTPDGILIVDETGFLKKGTKSCGVARQYSGTAGRIENCQIGVFLAYVSPRGRALIDRELYLPKDWAQDGDRRAEAKVPKAVEFATKIVLARQMIRRAVATQVPAKWVTADAVYGSDYDFRKNMEDLGLGYVVGVRSDFMASIGSQPMRVQAWVEQVPASAWVRVSCGEGAKGPREYNWTWTPVNNPDAKGSRRWLLIRRKVSDPTDVSYFACGGPVGTTLAELVRVAGSRWAVEECFELAKGDCGLDEYEVRSWVGWYRHVTLSLWALAVVAVIRSRVRGRSAVGKKGARSRF